MRWLWLFLIVLMFSGTAQAAYFNDSVIRLGNTSAWITLNQFTFDNFTSFNETDNPANTLQFYINGSQIRFTSNVNKTLTNPILNNATDNLTFQLSGSAGWLNFSTTMINASHSYNLTANGAFVESRNTTSDKVVWFNYTGDATLSVTWNASIIPTSPPTYMPPTPVSCTAIAGITWINTSCSAGSGNVTDGMNFSKVSPSSWQNGTQFYQNFTGLSEGTAYDFRIYGYNNSGAGTLNTSYASVSNTTLTTPVNGSPAITSYSPANLNPTIDVNAPTTFNAGANQTVQWTWTGATEGAGDGTTNSTATQTWTTTGAKTVNVTCSNANGSCGTTTWNVNVVSDGSGGGTDWDYLTGTVTPSGSTITINPSVTGSPTTGGAYTFGYVFVDGQTYWVNVSKAGYDSVNTQITFNQDHEVWSPTLSLSPTPTPTPTSTPTPSTIYNVQYQYGCSAPSGNITPQINIVYGMILVVIIIVLLVIIVGVIQENPLMGIIISGILIIASGAIYPQIIQSVYEAPLIIQGCTNTNDNINISGQQDVWIPLSHSQILGNSQTVSNSTYTATNVTDYQMDYVGGRIKPISSGNLFFGS